MSKWRGLVGLQLSCVLPFLLVAMFTSSCVSDRSGTPVLAKRCFSFKVVVTALDDRGSRVPPGVPVEITVRSKSGVVLRQIFTDSAGSVALEVCWSPEDEPWQIEAALHYGRQFTGTYVSFWGYSDTYCLTLPSHVGGHCGTWGTGPKGLSESR
jgi:hypothetical protein